MALKKDQNYVPHIKRNAGIANPDQIELVSKTSAPSDSDLADGRIYYNSTSGQNQLYARVSGVFQPLANNIMNINTVTYTTSLTDSYAGLIVVNNAASIRLTLPAASTDKGLTFTIVKDSADTEICAITAAGADAIWKNGVTQLNDMDAQADSYTLVADGSGTWHVISRYIS